MKNCGNCAYFVKLKSRRFSGGGGLCEALDARTKTDHGRNCKEWLALRYKRPKKINIRLVEGMDEE